MLSRFKFALLTFFPLSLAIGLSYLRVYAGEDAPSYFIYQHLNSEKQLKYTHNFGLHYSTRSFEFDNTDILTIEIDQQNVSFADIEYVKLFACGNEIEPNFMLQDLKDVTFELSADDHNVLVVHDSPVLVQWDVPSFCHDKLLVEIKANEYESDPAYPLRFPTDQGAPRPVYTYNLNGSVNIDADISEVDGVMNPTYTVLWYPGTGHPPANNYFYLVDDENYVYLLADIVSDNTNEFGMDWFQVTSYQNGLVKSFRVTDLDDTYGKCGFGYTSKASYKHQFCEIAIPKSELPIDQFEFSLEFYGTCGGDPTPPVFYINEPEPLVIRGDTLVITGWAQDPESGVATVTAIVEQFWVTTYCSLNNISYSEAEFTCTIPAEYIAAPSDRLLVRVASHGDYAIHWYDVITDELPPIKTLSLPKNNSIIGKNDSYVSFMLDEPGDCRAGKSDESYDDMSDDIDCTGDGTTDISCDISGLNDGKITLYVACKDESGNKDDASNNSVYSFIKDTRSPKKFKIGLKKDDLYYVGEKEIKVKNKKFRIYFDTSDSTTSVDKLKVSFKKNFDNATWRDYDGSVDVTLPDDDEKHTLYIKQKDKAGNSLKTYEQVVRYLPGTNGSGVYADRSKMTLEKIGTINYEPRYSAYFYTENYVRFVGSGSGKITTDGKEYDTKGSWEYATTLSTGEHTIRVGNTHITLVIDPTGQSFPENLRKVLGISDVKAEEVKPEEDVKKEDKASENNPKKEQPQPEQPEKKPWWKFW